MVELVAIQNRCGPLRDQTCFSNSLDESYTDVLKVNRWPEMFVMQKTSQDRKEHVWYTPSSLENNATVQVCKKPVFSDFPDQNA